MSMRSASLFLTVLGSLLACSSPFGVDRDGETLLQTEELEYRLRETLSGLRVEIPYTFSNRTGSRVYLVNCRGDVSPSLERKHGFQWVHGWASVKLMCLSSPVVIEPGAEYRDTLRVIAWRFGSNNGPRFETEEIEGVYRLRWDQALSSFDPNQYPFGEDIPLDSRVSNSFVLKDP
jgi:hypothetical protein